MTNKKTWYKENERDQYNQLWLKESGTTDLPKTTRKWVEMTWKNSTKRILYIRCFSASLKFVSAFRLLVVYLQTKEGKTTLALTVLNFSFSFRLTTALGMKSLCPLISKWPVCLWLTSVASVSWRPAVSLKKKDHLESAWRWRRKNKSVQF